MPGSYWRDRSKLFFLFQCLVDIFLVNIGFNTIYLYYSFYKGSLTLSTQEHMKVTLLVTLLALVFFQIYGVFRCGRRPYREIVLSAFLSLLFVNMIAITLTAVFGMFTVPLAVFILSSAFQLAYLMIWKRIVYKIYPSFYKPKTVAFIGLGEQVHEKAGKILAKDKNMFQVKYILDKVDEDTLEKIEEVDVVFISSEVDNNSKHAIINRCMARVKPVYVIPELFEIALYNTRMSRFDDVPALRIENLSLNIIQNFFKRLFDLLVSIILIILSSPVMLATYVAIKISDRGPAIFKQERVTRWKKSFNLYKFRTMMVDAEKLTGPVLATDKDPRITKMGAFLRSTRIDELPQLFNVLMGDMSIVGPRPERQHFIDQFKKELPDFEYRLNVKAGITGLAQVLGKYTTVAEDKLKFDLLYIRDYSFWLDLKIVLQTIKIMFMKASSQGVKVEKKPKRVERKLSEAK